MLTKIKLWKSVRFLTEAIVKCAVIGLKYKKPTNGRITALLTNDERKLMAAAVVF